MNPLRPCPDCGTPTRNPRHCTPPRRKRRNPKDEYQRARILETWRARYGDICPGTPWCNKPNTPHQTRDLTVDHTKPQSHGGTLATGWTVMCRTANSRKGTTHTTP